MKKLNGDMKARLEIAMMNGMVVPIAENDLVPLVLEYVVPVLAPHTADVAKYVNEACDTVFRKYNHKDEDRQVVAVSFCRVLGMPCMNFVLQDEEEPVTLETLRTGTYAFCYVLNFESDWCSEFGSVYFENNRRVY